MNKWLAIPDETKRAAYAQIGEKTGMSAFAAEKDWWVVQTLDCIFDMDVGKHLVFKGGTSLSKAWKIIQRFSEDIDLAIDRSFFGYDGDLNKKQVTRLRKESSAYISGDFFRILQEKFEEKGIPGLRYQVEPSEDSDQDPRIIHIYYPNVISGPGYLEPRIQVEIGCRSLREPFSMQTFASMVDEEFEGREFVQPPINIPTVNPERTFLEKIFLLHEEFHRPSDKIRVDRLSRHLYDVYKLSKTEFAGKALKDAALYELIVNHRYKFMRIGGVDYNLHQPKTIDPLPVPEVEKAWRDDYNTMFELMIYEEAPPSYEEIITGLRELKERINTLPWEFATRFPEPRSDNKHS